MAAGKFVGCVYCAQTDRADIPKATGLPDKQHQDLEAKVEEFVLDPIQISEADVHVLRRRTCGNRVLQREKDDLYRAHAVRFLRSGWGNTFWGHNVAPDPRRTLQWPEDEDE